MSTVKIEWQGEEYIVEGTYYPKRKAISFEPEESEFFLIERIYQQGVLLDYDSFIIGRCQFLDDIEQLCLEAYREKELYEAEERAILNYEFNL